MHRRRPSGAGAGGAGRSRPTGSRPAPAAAARAPRGHTASGARRHPGPAPAPVEPGALDAAALRRLWPEVLEVVKQASRRTRALLDNAQITDVDGELVSLSAPGALAKMIAEESNTVGPAGRADQGGRRRVADRRRRSGAGGGRRPRPSAARRRAAAPEPDPRDDADFEAGLGRGRRPRRPTPRPRRSSCCAASSAPARSNADRTPPRRPGVVMDSPPCVGHSDHVVHGSAP